MEKLYLETILGQEIVTINSLSGGCIANTQKITTASGNCFVCKLVNGDAGIKEANGLRELQKSEAIRVPRVVFAGLGVVIMEFINSGSRCSNFFEVFGNQLARLHQFGGDAFGFFEDNYIGSTPQVNNPVYTDWLSFYFENRLLFQFKLAEKNGYVDNNFRMLFNNLEQRLPSILAGSEELPVLLHGDLWGGNYMVDENGLPVLIDPAVYYGHREADLAMTKLFGGFPASFYSAYNAAYPLKPGYEYRESVYTLYHVLNHLNLFGSGYKTQAVQLMKQYL